MTDFFPSPHLSHFLVQEWYLIMILFLVLAIAGVNWLISTIIERVKFWMNSSIVLTTHFSLHENVNSRETSNPPEGIDSALYFNNFRVPKFLSIFFINQKINIARDFSWNIPHCFPTDEVGIPCFYSTRVWIGWK